MKNYELGSKTKKVTIMPNFALKLIGKFDAKKGEGVAEAHLMRYFDKCVSIEAKECLAAESFLKNTRKESARQLAIIKKQKKLIPEMPGKLEERHTWDVLENRRRTSDILNADSAIESARERLYELNENIIHGGAVLDERISRIRKRAGSKMDAYIKGLRAGGLSEYSPEIEFSDKAISFYYSRHQKLDDAIAAAASVPKNEEVQ